MANVIYYSNNSLNQYEIKNNQTDDHINSISINKSNNNNNSINDKSHIASEESNNISNKEEDGRNENNNLKPYPEDKDNNLITENDLVENKEKQDNDIKDNTNLNSNNIPTAESNVKQNIPGNVDTKSKKNTNSDANIKENKNIIINDLSNYHLLIDIMSYVSHFINESDYSDVKYIETRIDYFLVSCEKSKLRLFKNNHINVSNINDYSLNNNHLEFYIDAKIRSFDNRDIYFSKLENRIENRKSFISEIDFKQIIADILIKRKQKVWFSYSCDYEANLLSICNEKIINSYISEKSNKSSCSNTNYAIVSANYYLYSSPTLKILYDNNISEFNQIISNVNIFTFKYENSRLILGQLEEFNLKIKGEKYIIKNKKYSLINGNVINNREKESQDDMIIIEHQSEEQTSYEPIKVNTPLYSNNSSYLKTTYNECLIELLKSKGKMAFIKYISFNPTEINPISYEDFFRENNSDILLKDLLLSYLQYMTKNASEINVSYLINDKRKKKFYRKYLNFNIKDIRTDEDNKRLNTNIIKDLFLIKNKKPNFAFDYIFKSLSNSDYRRDNYILLINMTFLCCEIHSSIYNVVFIDLFNKYFNTYKENYYYFLRSGDICYKNKIERLQ